MPRHAMQLTKTDMKKAAHRLDALKSRVANIRKQAERTTEKALATAEVTGSAFAMGLIQGRTGGIEVMGVPIELGLGVGLTIGGFLGMAGKHSDHLNNVANGCLAAYATTMGRGVGAAWKDKALAAGSASPGTKTSGVTLTPEEIAASVAAAAAH